MTPRNSPSKFLILQVYSRQRGVRIGADRDPIKKTRIDYSKGLPLYSLGSLVGAFRQSSPRRAASPASAAIAMSVHRAREAKNVVTYGSARWATLEEVEAAGLLGPDGVLRVRLHARYLLRDGREHLFCFAPTRSGKGVGPVVPTLLAWPGSIIVHDIKGESWTLTAGWRARFGRVLLFHPTNGASSAYNPLLEVRRARMSPTFSSIPKAPSSDATTAGRRGRVDEFDQA